MSGLDDRLAALDPAAREPYQPRELDKMIARIVSSSPSPTFTPWWRRLRVRLGGAVVVAGALTAGAVALFTSGAALPVLAVQGAYQAVPSALGSTFAAAASERVRFSAGASLSAQARSGRVYELQSPASSERAARHVATVFGVTGELRHRADNWVTTDRAGASLDYQASAIPQWFYSSTTYLVAPATKSDTASVPMPSHATLLADATQYVTKLGLRYGLASPRFSASTVSVTNSSGAPAEQSQERLSAVVTVGSRATDQTLSITVGSRNQLIYAQGPDFRVRASSAYPLVSARAGVKGLEATERSLAGSATSPLLERVVLRHATLSLRAFHLSHGSTWLLPVYTYSSGSKNAATWSELAVEPTYLRLGPGVAQRVLQPAQ
ncbi:MAG TPA: hypothetical protein VMF33_04630 [Acidimicrobiales bacterium]|nr:hypothetical protein [Acidimicrobiales bacterium]